MAAATAADGGDADVATSADGSGAGVLMGGASEFAVPPDLPAEDDAPQPIATQNSQPGLEDGCRLEASPGTNAVPLRTRCDYSPTHRETTSHSVRLHSGLNIT